MRKFFLVAAITITLFFISCKKKASDTPETINYKIDLVIPNIIGGSTYLEFPQFSNVFGVLSAVQMRGTYTDVNGSVPLYSNDANAEFVSFTGSAGNGIVSINNVKLDTLTQQINLPKGGAIFINERSESLDFTHGCNWDVSNDKNVPNISFDYSGNFPVFTDSLPSVLSSANDYAITFDGSNCSDADSAFIVITTFDASLAYSNVVSAKGGKAIFPAVNFPYVKYGHGSINYLEVFLFRYTIKTFGNKQFAFMKMSENIRNVTIN